MNAADRQAERELLDHLAGKAHPYAVTVVPIVDALKNARVREGITRVLLIAHATCCGRVDLHAGPHLCLTCDEPWAPQRWPSGAFIAERADRQAQHAVFGAVCHDCLHERGLRTKLLAACKEQLGNGKIEIEKIRRVEE